MPKIFNEQEREVIRCKLLDAGIKILAKKRYRDIAIDEITAEVGIAKGTFYNFFPSKEVFFYEIMQLIKERNRDSLKNLICGEQPTKEDVINCLYYRYTQLKTVYDYFTPEEMKLIVRKLPNGDSQNDSVEFAEFICKHLTEIGADKQAAVIVDMCNMLALAASNRSLFEPDGYEQAIRIFCNAMAEYIFGKK